MAAENPTGRPMLAIIGGTGKEGPGLALRWASAGYTIIIGSRQAEKAQATADEVKAKISLAKISGAENHDAVRQASLCILTVIQEAHQAVLEDLKDVLQGKILVDATARVDWRDPRPPAPPAAARLAQDILGPGVRVVAAFQTVPSHVLKKNLDQPLDTDVLVCADDVAAADEVIALAAGAGMRGYYAGGLDNAVVVEGITSLLLSLNKRYGVKTASIEVTGISS